MNLVIDPYGNYLMQTIFKKCSVLQLRLLVKKMVGHMYMIVQDKKGTHTLQCLISLLKD